MSSLSMYDIYYVIGDFTISLIGMAANLFVVFLVVRCPALRTAPNVYVASLAVTDFTFCLWNLLLYTRKVFRALLDVKRIIAVFLLNASVFLLVAIAVERYNAILRPLMHIQTNALRRAVKTCFLVLFAAVMATTLDTVGRIAATNDWNFTGKSINNESIVLLNIQSPDVNDPLFVLSLVEFLIGYVIPACTSLFIYVRIAIKLCQSRRFVARGSGDHAFLMVFVVTLSFLMCCLPMHIISFNVHFFMAKSPSFIHMGSLMLPLNAVGNPFLYALLGKNFRLQIKRMLFCSSSCKKNFRMRRASFSSAAVTESTSVPSNVQVLRIVQVSRDVLEDVETAAEIEQQMREVEDMGDTRMDIDVEQEIREIEDMGEDTGNAEDVQKEMRQQEETRKDAGMAEDVEREMRKMEDMGEDNGMTEDVERERRDMEDIDEDTGIAKDVLKEMKSMEERKEDAGMAEDVEK